jgi:hypothetical protein
MPLAFLIGKFVADVILRGTAMRCPCLPQSSLSPLLGPTQSGDCRSFSWVSLSLLSD